MSGWSRLTEELDHWRSLGAPATFWWRDDDAVEPTPRLDLLLRHAESVPLSMAVIPALATRALAECLRDHPLVAVLQHGWRHANHAPGGNNEYPACRRAEEVSREFAEGLALLTNLFGRQAVPVFAPPWHGFDECFLPMLRQNGSRSHFPEGTACGPICGRGRFTGERSSGPDQMERPSIV